MEKNILKQLILEQQHEVQQIKLVHRHFEFDRNANYVLIGLRRAGKSYLMYQYIQQLIAQGEAKIEDILYVNFEDDRLVHMQLSDLQLLLDAYAEMFESKPRLFLDEIQNIPQWEKFARRLADNHYHVFITGSNAKMLSSEIYSTLGGRYMVKEVYPFSFAEYLDYYNVTLSRNWEFSNERFEIRHRFDDYFHFGGLAQVFDLMSKREWVNSLIQKVLLGDIVARNGIRNPQNIQLLTRKLAESVMQPTTQSRLQNIIKSTGQNIGRNSIAEYLSWMEAAYLIFGLSNFTDTQSERTNSQKHYFWDNALLNNYLFDPETKLLENLVAITLRRKYDKDQLFYYNKNIEVDFYVPTESMAIQVSYSLHELTTFERELRALVTLSKAFDIKKLLIITMDEERDIATEVGMVHVVPIWKWLLKQ